MFCEIVYGDLIKCSALSSGGKKSCLVIVLVKFRNMFKRMNTFLILSCHSQALRISPLYSENAPWPIGISEPVETTHWRLERSQWYSPWPSENTPSGNAPSGNAPEFWPYVSEDMAPIYQTLSSHLGAKQSKLGQNQDRNVRLAHISTNIRPYRQFQVISINIVAFLGCARSVTCHARRDTSCARSICDAYHSCLHQIAQFVFVYPFFHFNFLHRLQKLFLISRVHWEQPSSSTSITILWCLTCWFRCQCHYVSGGRVMNRQSTILFSVRHILVSLLEETAPDAPLVTLVSWRWAGLGVRSQSVPGWPPHHICFSW